MAKGEPSAALLRRGRRMSPASEGAKNEISASVERNRLRSLSSRGITIFALSTSSKMRLYSDGRYNCVRSRGGPRSVGDVGVCVLSGSN